MTKSKVDKSPSPLPSGVPGASYAVEKGDKSLAHARDAREDSTPGLAERRAPDPVSAITKKSMKPGETRMVVNALMGDPEMAAAVLAWDEEKLSLLGGTLQDAIYLRHLDLNPFIGASVLLQGHLNGLEARLGDLEKEMKVLAGLAVTQPNLHVQLLNARREREEQLKLLRDEVSQVKQRLAAMEARMPAMEAAHVASVADVRTRLEGMRGEVDRSIALNGGMDRHLALKDEVVGLLLKVRDLEAALAAADGGASKKKKKRARSPSPATVPAEQQESSEELADEQPAKDPAAAAEEDGSKDAQILRLQQQLEQMRQVSKRVPDLPKPPVYSGQATDMVEDRLFVFENYLMGSNIPKERWVHHVMPLLSDKALAAWTSVAVPAKSANQELTWDLFCNTMLSNFAHPDRQHKAREMLHKVAQSPSQGVTDYVRQFNSLVQRAGEPAPSPADLILFFHSGLLPALKDKCATNPSTGKFWDNLKALQDYVISVHTHGAAKQANLVPASARHASHSTLRAHTSRVAFVQARKGKGKKWAGSANPNAAGPSNPSKGGAKLSLEEADKRIAQTRRSLERQEAQRRLVVEENRPQLSKKK